MLRNRMRFGLAVLLLVWAQVQTPNLGSAAEIGAVIESVSSRLQGGQINSGFLRGAWPDEEAYTGSIVVGLVRTYSLTCGDGSRAAVTAGGDFIIRTAFGNFYGDEAYALACLSQMSPDTMNNSWRSALAAFYVNVKQLTEGGTVGYISQFGQAELSVGLFYVANHTVAAYYVDAEDKALWRDALLRYLACIDDDFAAYPVMSLGIATWALAATGPLDDSLVDSDAQGVARWQGKTLDELPGLLLQHQVSTGDLAGTFYWRFDHGDGGTGVPVAGYAEDTAFGALGLIAANKVLEDPSIYAAIVKTRNILIDKIGDEGLVPPHLLLGGDEYRVHAAEVLRVLAESVNPVDVNLRSGVDLADLAALAERWGEEDCEECCRCARRDVNRDGRVDVADLRVLGEKWLQE